MHQRKQYTLLCIKLQPHKKEIYMDNNSRVASFTNFTRKSILQTRQAVAGSSPINLHFLLKFGLHLAKHNNATEERLIIRDDEEKEKKKE